MIGPNGIFDGANFSVATARWQPYPVISFE
jgi:hypothetical protein